MNLKALAKKKQLLAQFHASHDQSTHGNWATNPGITGKEEKILKNLDPAIRPTVQEMLEERRQVEPTYTDLFSDLAEAQGGDMIGLKFKFKGANGIIGKIDRKVKSKGISPEEAAKDIADSLRYTIAFPPDDYTEGVKATIKTLADRGIEFESLENNWQRGDAYNGINAVFLDTNTGLKIELQFHTPESFNVKDKVIHEDYEFVRERKGTSAQRLLAFERMRQSSDAITFPKNIESLSGKISGVEVVDLFRPSTDTLFTKTRDELLRF